MERATVRKPANLRNHMPAHPATAQPGIGHYRWFICGLLFFTTTIKYVDRAVIGFLKNDFFIDQLHWTDGDFGIINAMYTAGYAIGFLVMGGIVDRIGLRRGLALAVGLWSLAAAGHGLVGLIPVEAQTTLPSGTAYSWSAWLFNVGSPAAAPYVLLGVTSTVLGMALARLLLGLAEAGSFPAAIKAVSEWFPKRERALATGIFIGGSNLGIILAALAVPPLARAFGWPAAFYFTGGVGLAWFVVWLVVYRAPEQQPRLSPAELAYIRSDGPEPKRRAAWWPLFGHRQTWAFALAKFLTDPWWWFYLFWIPGFLQEQHHVDLRRLGLPLVVIYVLADLGSIAGGWISSRLIHRGWSVNASRKTTMLISALCVVPICAAVHVENLWPAVLLIGLAAAAHQGFSVNLCTVATDTVPRDSVSSVVGIGAMAGAVGGILMNLAVGFILQWTKNYQIPFLLPAVAYLLALALLHWILPRLEGIKHD